MNRRRMATVPGLVVFALLLLSGCTPGVSIGYKPPFVPVEFGLGSDGVFRATIGASITTFLGTFSLKGSASTPLKPGSTRVSIAHAVGGATHVDVNDIGEDGPIALCLNGRFSQLIDQNTIDIELLDSTSTVRLGSPEAAEPCRDEHGATVQGAAITPPPGQPPAANPIEMTTIDVRGRWTGTYICAQGETGLVLDIAGGSSDALTATFGFHPIASNPNAASGSFAMTGSDVDGHLELRRDHWINQPNGYSMVDLVADTGSGTATLSGSVIADTSGCSTFTVHRAASSAASNVSAVVGTWTGTYVCSQGETGLRLGIATAGSDVTATFAFFAAPSNPGVPSGRFAMRGSYADGVLVLNHDHWIVQPPGYVMVDLVSDVAGSSADTLHGTVRGAGCDSFTVHRE